MSEGSDKFEALMGLIEAGFTREELQSIAAEFQFAATVSGGMEQSVTIDPFTSVEWTPEKLAAWDELVRKWRFSGGTPDDQGQP